MYVEGVGEMDITQEQYDKAMSSLKPKDHPKPEIRIATLDKETIEKILLKLKRNFERAEEVTLEPHEATSESPEFDWFSLSAEERKRAYFEYALMHRRR